MAKQLIISTTTDLVQIAPENIIYISSDGNYSTLVQTDGEISPRAGVLSQPASVYTVLEKTEPILTSASAQVWACFSMEPTAWP